MTARRARLSLLLFPLLVVLAVVVASLPSTTHKDAVGTDGPRTPKAGNHTTSDLEPGDAPSSTATSSGSEDVSASSAVATTSPTSTPGDTTTTAQPVEGPRSSTTTTPAAPATPRNLLGRIVYSSYETGAGPPTATTWSIEADGTGTRREVDCPTGFAAGTPMDVSPDGRYLVRNCGVPPSGMPMTDGYGLALQDVATGAIHTLVVDGGAPLVTPTGRWSPNGKTIAIVDREVPGIRLYDVATGVLRNLATDRAVDANSVSWSPDGTRLLTDVWDLVDVATGHVTTIDPLAGLSDVADHTAQLPTWAPSGAIYFYETGVATVNGQPASLDRLDPDGHTTRLVPDASFLHGALLPLPDGRLFVPTLPLGTAETFDPDAQGPRTFTIDARASDMATARPVAGLATTG